MDPKKERARFKSKYDKLIDKHYKEYPKRIENLREAKDKNNRNFKDRMTQREIAFIAELSPANYGRVEMSLNGGGNNITISQAIKLSVIYGCSLNYIILGEEDDSTLLDTVRTLEDLLETERSLNKMYQETIRKLQDERLHKSGK